MGLLSDGTLLDFGMFLSTAVLIAVTIKSACLSRSLADVSSEKSSEPNAALSVGCCFYCLKHCLPVTGCLLLFLHSDWMICLLPILL